MPGGSGRAGQRGGNRSRMGVAAALRPFLPRNPRSVHSQVRRQQPCWTSGGGLFASPVCVAQCGPPDAYLTVSARPLFPATGEANPPGHTMLAPAGR